MTELSSEDRRRIDRQIAEYENSAYGFHNQDMTTTMQIHKEQQYANDCGLLLSALDTGRERQERKDEALQTAIEFLDYMDERCDPIVPKILKADECREKLKAALQEG